LIIILFILSPLFDVFNNYFAFVLGAQNDFYGIKGTIGYFWTHTIGLLLTFAGMLTLWRVLVIYRKHPDIHDLKFN
jgi:hypothetical protein